MLCPCCHSSRTANARTGKLPIPRTFTGTAKNRNPASGSSRRPHRCSTIGIPAPSSRVCAGRAPSAASSMLSESMPTRAARPAIRCSAAARVQEGMAGTVPLAAPMDVPARVHEDRLAPHIAAAQ